MTAALWIIGGTSFVLFLLTFTVRKYAETLARESVEIFERDEYRLPVNSYRGAADRSQELQRKAIGQAGFASGLVVGACLTGAGWIVLGAIWVLS